MVGWGPPQGWMVHKGWILCFPWEFQLGNFNSYATPSLGVLIPALCPQGGGSGWVTGPGVPATALPGKEGRSCLGKPLPAKGRGQEGTEQDRSSAFLWGNTSRTQGKELEQPHEQTKPGMSRAERCGMSSVLGTQSGIQESWGIHGGSTAGSWQDSWRDL